MTRTRVGLWQKNANEIALKRITFLKDRAIYGLDVYYKELGEDPNSNATFDPLTDRYPDQVMTVKKYPKFALQVPLSATAIDADLQGHAITTAVGFGFKFENIDTTTDMIARVDPALPLSPTSIYSIAGVSYKLKKLIDSPSFATKKPLWNLVWFSSAGVAPQTEVEIALPDYVVGPGGGGGGGGVLD